MRLPEWKALLITEQGIGLWTYVPAEDFEAAIENAEKLSGLEVVMVERLPSRPLTLTERIAA